MSKTNSRINKNGFPPDGEILAKDSHALTEAGDYYWSPGSREWVQIEFNAGKPISNFIAVARSPNRTD